MSVLLYETGLTEVLVSPVGPVSRYITETAEAVAELARQNVRSNFRTRTGSLEASIDVFPNGSPDGLECQVGTDGSVTKDGWNYGLILELGSNAHEIIPNTQPVLVSPPGHPDPLRAPRFRVNAPGLPPKPWLLPALQQVFGA